MSEKVFADGLIMKKKQFSWGEITTASIKVEEFIKFLQQHNKNGWVNLNIKESREGKPYAELDTWEPTQQGAPPPVQNAEPQYQAPAPAQVPMSADGIEDSCPF